MSAARKETAREKQLKEEEKILESVAEKTGPWCLFIFCMHCLCWHNFPAVKTPELITFCILDTGPFPEYVMHETNSEVLV